jgi:hypothetical protein
MEIRAFWRRFTLSVALSAIGACSGLITGCGSSVTAPSPSSPLSAAVSNGPQLGYLWSATDATLRPILGVPGSSQFGQAVTPAGLYINAAASVRSSIAVLQSANGVISTMTVPQGSARTITGATFSGNAQIVFSPSGLNAVLYTPGSGSVLLLTALGSTPQIQTLTAPSNLLAATVSDTAQVAAVSGTSKLTVSLLTGNTASLAALGGFGGFSFLPGGSDLLIADRSTNLVTLVRNTSGTPAAQTFAAPTIKSPFAIAGSVDGLWAVVANSADQSVVRIDLTSATAPLRIACACQPSQLTTLNGNAVFSLTTPASTAAWAVDASAATPRTVFIPALVKP